MIVLIIFEIIYKYLKFKKKFQFQLQDSMNIYATLDS